jgi:hypothetical protein
VREDKICALLHDVPIMQYFQIIACKSTFTTNGKKQDLKYLSFPHVAYVVVPCRSMERLFMPKGVKAKARAICDACSL